VVSNEQFYLVGTLDGQIWKLPTPSLQKRREKQKNQLKKNGNLNVFITDWCRWSSSSEFLFRNWEMGDISRYLTNYGKTYVWLYYKTYWELALLKFKIPYANITDLIIILLYNVSLGPGVIGRRHMIVYFKV